MEEHQCDQEETCLAPPAAIARGARKRGYEIAQEVCAWCQRWGWVTNQTLEVLYPGRPRLGYEMSRRGYFRQHVVEPGEHLSDGKTIYSLTYEGAMLASEILPPQVLELDRKQEKREPWRDMQHRLDLQRIAVWYGMLPAESDWWSDPENRIRRHPYYDLCTLVPDVLSWAPVSIAHIEPSELGLWWIEYDRTHNRSNDTLNYWTQQFARMQQRALLERDESSVRWYQEDPDQRRPELAKITIIVKNEYQKDRYKAMFERELVKPFVRDPETRKVYPKKDAPKLPLYELIGSKVQVLRLDELQGTIRLPEPEEQRQRVLKSRFENYDWVVGF